MRSAPPIENADQRALRLWLTAGLAIPEVVGLHGDAGYLLDNMIAKYTLAADTYAISTGALAEFQRQGVDLRQSYTRSKFYGTKKAFIYEHSVPVGLIRRAILAGPRTEAAVLTGLLAAGFVAVLLRTENDWLKSAKLNSKMPEGWQLGHDPLARYNAVGINLSDQVLRVRGAIKR